MSEEQIAQPGGVPLEYAAPGAEKGRWSVYPAVIFLGAAPLVVGTSITVLFALTRWHGLEMAGFFAILAGLVSVLIACFFLYSYWAEERKAGRQTRESLFLRVFLAVVLLASNFPAAVACMSVAWDIRTRLNITVVNRGTTPIKSCILVTDRETKELGPIAAGGRAHYSMRNPGGGSLRMTRSTSTGSTTTTLVDYVDEDVHGDWTVVLDGDTTTLRW
jgi:hypothetical protein